MIITLLYNTQMHKPSTKSNVYNIKYWRVADPTEHGEN